MSERTYKVPRWLDLPEKILVFTVDEFLAFVGVAGALIMFSEIWIAMPTAALVVVGMRKFKGALALLDPARHGDALESNSAVP